MYDNKKKKCAIFIQNLYFRNLLHSSSIEVSYFAAGIVAHLSSNSLDQWSHLLISKVEL